jgi:uncharacterized protein YicC (UPF0701 family)
MKPDEKPSAIDRLLDAYSVMLERANETIDEAEKQAVPAFENAVEKAQEMAHELGELTREEAKKVGEYLKRDMHDAGRHMAESRKELAEWFRFDVQQVESRLWDAFSQAADKTSLELMKLASFGRRNVTYRSGEIAGLGTLLCDACGAEIHFEKPAEIPKCPKCGGELFHRPV